MKRYDMSKVADVGTALRDLVEAGEPDGPFTVVYDGHHCMSGTSLHYSALRYVAEAPVVGFKDWSPHPTHGKVGPRIQALLDAREVRRATKLAARNAAKDPTGGKETQL